MIFFILYLSISGIALRILFSINFFDLKNGQINEKNLLEKLDANLNPKILNIKKRIKIIKN